MDAALLIARLIIGLGLAAHGTQKLLGWFSAYGLKGTAGFFESIGFRPGVLFAPAPGLGGVAGGLLTTPAPVRPPAPPPVTPRREGGTGPPRLPPQRLGTTHEHPHW